MVVQRLLGCLTITAEQKATIPIKRTKPRRRIACSGVHLCAETAEKPYFKRFSDIEKNRRNSNKITADIWRRERDSNPWYGSPYTRFPIVRLRPAQPSLQLYVQSIIRHLHIIQHRVKKSKLFLQCRWYIIDIHNLYCSGRFNVL